MFSLGLIFFSVSSGNITQLPFFFKAQSFPSRLVTRDASITNIKTVLCIALNIIPFNHQLFVQLKFCF